MLLNWRIEIRLGRLHCIEEAISWQEGLLRLGYFKFNIMASDDKFKATERSNIVGTYIGTQPR